MGALLRRWGAVVVAGAALLSFARPAGAYDAPTYGKPFCEGKPVHDYQRVFERMPPAHPPPENEDLPFGPHNMSIYQSAISRVEVGRGGFGYRFSDGTYGIRKQVDLSWDVTTSLARVDRAGRPGRVVASENQYLGVIPDNEIGELSFWLDVPAGPALYRYDIEFRDHTSGRVLGHYWEYLRVVRPRFRARIAVNRKEVHPGGTIYARVENPGTEWVSYGVAYEVQRREGGRWVEQPLGVGGWILIGLAMGSGGSGSCMKYHVPVGAEPGLYRFVKEMARGFTGRRDRRYTAAFRVFSF
jgi:hypothetical protein